jgi:hypothetical protein
MKLREQQLSLSLNELSCGLKQKNRDNRPPGHLLSRHVGRVEFGVVFSKYQRSGGLTAESSARATTIIDSVGQQVYGQELLVRLPPFLTHVLAMIGGYAQRTSAKTGSRD